MARPQLDYSPPPTIGEFIADYTPGQLFHNWIIGPVGSGKTTGIFFKLIYMASLQAPSPRDGVRRSRANPCPGNGRRRNSCFQSGDHPRN